jgi:ParB family chromosome partitioning protein
MQSKTESIELEKINTNNDFYKITTCNEIDEISHSIHEIGIINPPVLVQDEQKFIIVCGFRRIKAAEKNGFSHIQAKIVRYPEKSIECVKIAISDNSFQRKLNLVEQARSIRLLTLFIDAPEEIADTASKLNLPGNISVIEKLNIISRSDQIIQDFILSDSLSMTTILLIEKLKEKQRIPIARFIQSLNVGLNIQRELFILLTEISFREGIDPIELLAEKFIADILKNDNLEPKQKAVQIRKLLRMRRFPELSRAESHFFDCMKMLKLDPSIKLHPPKDFESTTYCFSLFFNSYEELLGSQKKLDEVIDNPVMKKIIE